MGLNARKIILYLSQQVVGRATYLLFRFVKNYVVNIWEVCNIKLHDESSQSQSSNSILGDITGIEGQSGKNMCQGLARYTHVVLV